MIKTMSLVSAMLLVNGVANAGLENTTTEETPMVYGLEGLDSNADGQISHEEAALDPLLADAFRSIDANADGQLTESEFDLFFDADDELVEAE